MLLNLFVVYLTGKLLTSFLTLIGGCELDNFLIMKMMAKNGWHLSVNQAFKKAVYLLVVCIFLNTSYSGAVQLASSTISELAASDKLMDQTKMLHLAQSTQLPNQPSIIHKNSLNSLI